jgi:deoxyadenosine/deoxycytidine kinase
MTLVFLSGPHGAGKSTLEQRLKDAVPEILVPELRTTTPKFHTAPIERTILKTCGRAIENYEALQVAKRHPDRIVLANRCIYDHDAYGAAYHDLGWITDDQYLFLQAIIRNVFPTEVREPRAIVLNPPFDVVRERLEGRWTFKEKKWKEEDLEYLAAACQAYERYRHDPNVLYLTDNAVTPSVLSWVDGHVTRLVSEVR